MTDISTFTSTRNSDSDFIWDEDSGEYIPVPSSFDNQTIRELEANSTIYDIVSKGIVDNNTDSSLKVWTGTKAQYNAITTKDSNTLYNITDDQNPFHMSLDVIWPVGSIYIGKTATCPLAAVIGTWSLIGTKILTDNPSNVPVVGNGKALGIMDSSNTKFLGYGNNGLLTGTGSNTNVGQSLTGSALTLNKMLGVSNDSSKSGIVANMSSVSNIVVNIWERTA